MVSEFVRSSLCLLGDDISGDLSISWGVWSASGGWTYASDSHLPSSVDVGGGFDVSATLLVVEGGSLISVLPGDPVGEVLRAAEVLQSVAMERLISPWPAISNNGRTVELKLAFVRADHGFYWMAVDEKASRLGELRKFLI